MLALDFTHRTLLDAGIRPGMRVLDIGCGGGDVTFLVAQLVGPEGSVVGIDRDPRPIAAASERARSTGATNVRFGVGDFDALADETFDAIVGRRVLMYQPDAVAALRQLMPRLQPGGLLFFQEHDSATVSDGAAAWPEHAKVRAWIWETVRREGADLHMGLGLPGAMTAAGFVVEGVRAEATILTPTTSHPIAWIVRMVQPRIVAHGVATDTEIDIETLEQRLTAERMGSGSALVWELMFGVWAKKPS